MRLPLLSVGPWIFSVALGGWPLHPTYFHLWRGARVVEEARLESV